MKTIRFFLFGILLMAAMSLVSCRKDPSVPTGKVFNAESGGDNTLDSLTISVIANPSNGGEVDGGGTYRKGQECTVIASPNDGYTFVNWRENDSIVAEDKLFRFTVVNNRTLVAHFATNPQSFTVSVSANPSNGGIVTGGGVYQQGQQCAVTATANEGYTFVNWTENGSVASTNASYQFTVTCSRTLVANFTAQPQVPQGAICGKFTINEDGDRVYFSQGNLQYQASTNIWKFADNQYDYIGSENTNVSQTYRGWIDLFGWGTSGWNNGNSYYHPWDSDNSDGSLYGPPGHFTLTDSYSNADQWRTLDGYEWRYVLMYRTTTSGFRYAKAQVNGVNGVLLLPDDWDISTYSLNYINNDNASFNSNVISATQWMTLENAGAVFLPAAGYRDGTSVSDVGSFGDYWTTWSSGDNSARFVGFNDGSLGTYDGGSRHYGRSVRLVTSHLN